MKRWLIASQDIDGRTGGHNFVVLYDELANELKVEETSTSSGPIGIAPVETAKGVATAPLSAVLLAAMPAERMKPGSNAGKK